MLLVQTQSAATLAIQYRNNTPIAVAGPFANPVVWSGATLTFNNKSISTVSICQTAQPWYWAGISNGVIILACNGAAAGYDSSSLAPLWNTHASGIPCLSWQTALYRAAPTLHDNYLYWPCSTVFALDIQTGALKFPQRGNGSIIGDFGAVGVVGNGYIASDSRTGLVVLSEWRTVLGRFV